MPIPKKTLITVLLITADPAAEYAPRTADPAHPREAPKKRTARPLGLAVTTPSLC